MTAGTRSFWIALLVLVALLGAVFAYYTLFSTFKTWDDEGWIMMSVKFFNDGYPLYDDVFSQYGPVFYLVSWLTIVPASIQLGSDAIRLVTLVYWTAIALISGAVTWRVTRSPLLAIVVHVLVVTYLNLHYEPGHPQALCWLLTVIVPWLGTLIPSSRGRAAWFALGACAGLLVMTKVNLGVFLLVALGILILSAARSLPARVLWPCFVAGALALPAILMSAHTDEPWAGTYAVVVTGSLASSLLVIVNRKTGALPTLRDELAVIGGLSLTIVSASAITCILGTTPYGLLHGILLQHVGFPTTFFVRAPFAAWSLICMLVSLLLAWLSERTRIGSSSGFRSLLTGAKLAFGLAVLVAAVRVRPDLMLNFGLAFAWLALIPGGGDEARAKQSRFARTLLVLVTVLESLQAYPVAGSQLSGATFLVIICAAVTSGDAYAEIRALHSRGWRSATATLAVVVLAVGFLGRETMSRRRSYSALVSLDLPGAHRLRLPEYRAVVYRRLTQNLREHADSFVTYPGMDSFHFWSEIDPPTHRNVGHWMTLFDAEEQRRIVEAINSRQRLCVIRHMPGVREFLRGQEVDGLPLVRMIDDDFKTIEWADAYEFRVRREQPQ